MIERIYPGPAEGSPAVSQRRTFMSVRKVRSMVALVLVLGGCASTESSPASEPTEGEAGGGGNGGPPAGPPPPSGVASSLSSIVDHVGLDYVYDGAYGAVVPVLLLNDGVACDCFDEDLDNVTLADLQRRRPEALGQWRVNGEQIDLNWGKGWDELYFTATGLPLGDDWRTSTTYIRITSIGAAGTDTYAAASKEITFDETGRFAFAGAAVADGSTATSRSRGSYAVKGWMATLHFDDGTERRLTALTSSDKPGGTLWLGGGAYSQ
jgi:hypothetical protein